MTFSPETLTLLVMIALGLSVLALAFSALSKGRSRTEQPRDPVRVPSMVRGLLQSQAQQIRQLEAAVRSMSATEQQRGGLIEGAVRHVGLVRYDAFEDVGGRLSFSCALLDARGNGVVMTSINGRQDTRVYAKPVIDGRSANNLSIEEEEAIRQALATPRETVEAT